MRKNFLLLTILASLAIMTVSCNHNKIPCPTYADSFPEKKGKKAKPSKPPKPPKSRSGVLPSDGRGTRTVTPN